MIPSVICVIHVKHCEYRFHHFRVIQWKYRNLLFKSTNTIVWAVEISEPLSAGTTTFTPLSAIVPNRPDCERTAEFYYNSTLVIDQNTGGRLVHRSHGNSPEPVRRCDARLRQSQLSHLWIHAQAYPSTRYYPVRIVPSQSGAGLGPSEVDNISDHC